YLLILAFLVQLLAPAQWLGRLYYLVIEGELTWLSPLIGPVERACYRISGVAPITEQSWKQFAWAVLAFNLAGFVVMCALLMMRGV
ncbi:potassium-transporting ATPase subunit KdpA, partial [Pseudomonas syringae group genomosp. 7]|uniref:potassium-transporting ATPase subunit KdpA n=1 Tax=Pseudomonas syringae group genomosp. 7 TaxID=251699 RepID=UPI0037702D73